jgi:hypothetical protein
MLPAGGQPFRGRRCKAVQEQVHHHISEFLRLDIAFGIVPAVAEIEHEQHHGIIDLTQVSGRNRNRFPATGMMT